MLKDEFAYLKLHILNVLKRSNFCNKSLVGPDGAPDGSYQLKAAEIRPDGDCNESILNTIV